MNGTGGIFASFSPVGGAQLAASAAVVMFLQDTVSRGFTGGRDCWPGSAHVCVKHRGRRRARSADR